MSTDTQGKGVVTFNGVEYGSITHLLHSITYSINGSQFISPEDFHQLLDLISEHAHHTTFEFDDELLPDPPAWLKAFWTPDSKKLTAIGTALITRLMYKETTPFGAAGRPNRMISLLVLMGVPVSVKTMCCAAVLEAPHHPAYTRSWLQTFIGYSVSILDDQGQLIVDVDTGKNILEIASDFNVTVILKTLRRQHTEKSVRVKISHSLYMRICNHKNFTNRVFLLK